MKQLENICIHVRVCYVCVCHELWIFLNVWHALSYGNVIGCWLWIFMHIHIFAGLSPHNVAVDIRNSKLCLENKLPFYIVFGMQYPRMNGLNTLYVFNGYGFCMRMLSWDLWKWFGFVYNRGLYLFHSPLFWMFQFQFVSVLIAMVMVMVMVMRFTLYSNSNSDDGSWIRITEDYVERVTRVYVYKLAFIIVSGI